MTDTRVFVENSLRGTVRFAPDGTVTAESTRRRGACLEQSVGRDHVRHVAADGVDLLAGPAAGISAPVAEAGREVLARPVVGLDPAERQVLADLAAETGATATWAGYHQHVLAGPLDAPTADTRSLYTVEVDRDGTDTEVVPLRPDGGVTTGLGEVRAALDRLDARSGLPRAALPHPVPDLVLLPGRAGAFFHELVGHPMEADVVVSGTSYLGARRGRRVGPEWLTVTDGATPARTGVRAAVDDEGTPTAGARLVDAGVVGDPMTDLGTAPLAGTAPRGHGRRLDYRHPAIPRMTHTSAVADTGDPSPDGTWIAPFGLSLDAMSIATGDFRFVARTPLLHEAGTPVARLPELTLTGNGLLVLAGILPAGRTAGEHARASRGCGKLGQFPLIVSFANSGFLLPAGLVEVAEHD
ncbi:metallopeptidase TldD-related protein [Marinitenerispora sediminis]|uniref:Peptidase C69 n=1 Tax=Marinitenerispora sediminis TaxID=1931232 RepID=A0A368TAF9_9ACTN|nr:metallopeptidase TldD-related protein [Marinitenerispora sediminis]RCV53986.1 peptidase C69 [Marinitenerispora sediminis]RCV60463.1 peptidase C69 [Marinitenerispora sediminis]RCV61857.1 peptidase C69 [Marinitenerispora sediminis]